MSPITHDRSKSNDPQLQHEAGASPYVQQPSKDLEPPQHQSGDVPPALSPLDAFALQGRMLAAKFEEQDGKRLSRLPHLTIASELSKPRPTYSSAPRSPISPSSNNHTPTSDTRDGSGTNPALGAVTNKHQSYYPSIQTFDDAESILTQDSSTTEPPGLDPVAEDAQAEATNTGDYGLSRSKPPGAVDTRSHNQVNHPVRSHPRSLQDQFPPVAELSQKSFVPGELQKSSTGDSFHSTNSGGLAPPRSPIPRSKSPQSAQPSIRSVRMDSGDESDAYSMTSDPYESRSYDRKPSASGAVLPRARSPFSPVFAPKRSPSISSDHSAGGGSGNATRRSVNFSRPMSPIGRLGRPSLDTRPSFDTMARHVPTASDSLPRPSLEKLSLDEPPGYSSHRRLPSTNEPRPSQESQKQSFESVDHDGVPAYTYAKYSLPRGRVVTRESVTVGDWMSNKFQWEQNFGNSNAVPVENSPTSSFPEGASHFKGEPAPEIDSQRQKPSLQENASHSETKSQQEAVPRAEPAARQPRFKEELDLEQTPNLQPNFTRELDKQHKRSRSSDAVMVPPQQSQTSHPDLPAPVSISSLTAQKEMPRRSFDTVPTLKRTHKSKKSSTDITSPTPDQLSAEDHLVQGIKSHEDGSLQKSTYHLRIAARAGNPTAMLLYALACRHGWGMRPNQSEGILWLRKAVDTSKVDVVDNELLFNTSSTVDGQPISGKSKGSNIMDQRERKVQLALAIYEIGISYNNGWGIQQDRHLALRCFEIAASWGDVDALSEAGYCYANGVGCKKDLHKAADFYRRAGAKGVSTTGISWIYKDKYMPRESKDEERHGRSADKEKEKDKDKKGRDKSRTRSIFRGRKKSNAAGD